MRVVGERHGAVSRGASDDRIVWAMRVPIVIGSTETVEPTGAKFRGVCPTCHAPQTIYAAKKKFAVKAFLAVSLWDSEETVEQCGACRTCFAPGTLEKLEEAPPSESLAERVAGFLRRKREAAPATAPPTAPPAVESARTCGSETTTTRSTPSWPR